MFQVDETADTYLYYVHDIITTDNHTPVDKATSELFPLGSDDIARHLEARDIRPNTLEAYPTKTLCARH